MFAIAGDLFGESERLASVKGNVRMLFADAITSAITSANGYYTAAAAVGVLVMLFVIGKSIVKKVAKG